jgi:hypothetical protein
MILLVLLDVQLAREQAEKAAGVPLSGSDASGRMTQASVLTPPASSKPAAVPLSHAGITAAVASTAMPTIPVASTISGNAKLQ